MTILRRTIIHQQHAALHDRVIRHHINQIPIQSLYNQIHSDNWIQLEKSRMMIGSIDIIAATPLDISANSADYISS